MARIDAGQLSYRIDGDRGPLLLLLHGLGSCAADWVLQVGALRGHFRCLTVDLPGHGDSPMPAGWPTLRDMANDVAGLLLELAEGPAHLVGLSLGGGVALVLALERPELVRSLTVVNASASLSGGWQRIPSSIVRLALLLGGPMDWLGAWVARGLFPAAHQSQLRELTRQRIAGNSRLSYLKSAVAILRFDLRNRVSQIATPTLVVAGDRDRTVLLKAKRALAAAIPEARLHIVEGSGHATPLDAAERFNAILLDFLHQLGQPTAGVG